MSEITNERKSDLLQAVDGRLREGFTPIGEIVESIAEPGDDGDQLARFARVAMDQALAALRAEQSSWPAETDCDRLDRAFAELDRAGVVARQNFSCCQTCGAGEMDDEIDAAEGRGVKVRGYVYYHLQDTESAVEGYGLCLSYGSVTGEGLDSVAIGHEVVDALARHGLRASWSGDLLKRISVPLDWKRRLPDGGS